ncbi:DNA photolyase family protein [Burkholderia multivorans]|uniref:Deoxyribodipyrimidine photo-lyase n=5 Tax=Burkholderia cepacia complex TaxID=87882 RepID=A0A0H3KQC3_BURM1|nr:MULTISPECIES: deoxyribodipyrimidine photo-lyase [Burkholderia cepacia complex]ABX19512.1 Deoxyribodipyrimidine photo-lyase [Burkholderia multivorans ATCC 17616]AIO71682.1 FAD binding domain of DNA photolyase family protein [Burkholderia multivorans]AOK69376.1 deoxyribodipyrimidine photolyase [Burkholderia multivorans]AYY99650.1 deoxyribodipyrimidine photo-lyase [Burkholderia multivorans]KVV23002.1 deoxyribodipyrimidine photolyase [Burkholderia multivorans]
MTSSELPYESRPVVVWFRDDQRLGDNPALCHAVASGHPVVCVYVHDPAPSIRRPMGGAQRWWLHESLGKLDDALSALGGSLIVLRGDEHEAIRDFAVGIGAAKVVWNRRYSKAHTGTDASIKQDLVGRGIAVSTFNGHLLHEPWTVLTREGLPYQVFSAYWRAACRDDLSPPPPLPAPSRIAFFPVPHNVTPHVCTLRALGLQPTAPDWASGLRLTWRCGEEAARQRLDAFLEHSLRDYADMRDLPAAHATSRLSPYLRFGNISVRQVWYAASSAASAMQRTRKADLGDPQSGPLNKFLSEIGWREFSYHLLYHFPPLHQVNFRRQFDSMPWRDDPNALRKWQTGHTGYPLVDAGMRELWHTGWMHNRVRMVVASFLSKHLLIDWREGEAWFWDTLVDADEASNPASWQWVSGSGADAAPYFRIFNPVLQGQKFDPQGEYTRHWVPELSKMSAEKIHAPWTASAEQLHDACVSLGRTYPFPIVDHQAARTRALESVKRVDSQKNA